MRNSQTREFLLQEFLDYVAGGTSLAWATDEAKGIFHRASMEWGSAPCDPDGPTPVQDRALDGIIDDAIQSVFDLGDDAFVGQWVFSYRHIGKYQATTGYREYDGFTCGAPNEELAWECFLGCSGEYGIPDGRDYTIDQVRS